MKNPRLILEEVYQNAYVERNTLPVLSPAKREWVKVVVAGAESQKAVLTVLVTSLVKRLRCLRKTFGIIRWSYLTAILDVHSILSMSPRLFERNSQDWR